jgi:hypothetical protein
MYLSTRSTGATLVLWLIGILYAGCGVIMYIEYGLSVPRRSIDGGDSKALPRSGGDLNYVSIRLGFQLSTTNDNSSLTYSESRRIAKIPFYTLQCFLASVSSSLGLWQATQ